jgi:hypothetical protein
MFDVPILILFYNRSSTLIKVLRQVRKINPKKIYLFCDGPKNIEDNILVNSTRIIADSFSFAKATKVKKNYLKKNKGLRNAVINGIDWFFSHEQKGIILEDDCLPSKSFFYFCKKNLIYHKKNMQVMNIGGLNLVEQIYKKNFCAKNYSYFFSKSPMIWGWATWKSRWKKFDKSMKMWDEIYKSEIKRKLYFPDYYSNNFYPDRIQEVREGRDSSWAYSWDYTLRVNHGLNLTPKKNLVKNIGFGDQATHSSQDYKDLSKLKVNNLIIKKHYELFQTNFEYDYLLSKFLCKKTLSGQFYVFFRTLLVNRYFDLRYLIKKNLLNNN